MTITSETRARLTLLRATQPPATAIASFVGTYGPVDALDRIQRGAAPGHVLREVSQPQPDIEPDLRTLDTGIARLITPDDLDWPLTRLNDLQHAGYTQPLALWIHGSGSLEDFMRSAVTITGARAATGYGEECAALFGRDVARHGITVLSGGAYGIDAAAHRGALLSQGRTVAVLAGGVDVLYPTGNAALLRDIVESNGLLVSESPIGVRPTQRRFRARARLLAALTTATIIVEAGARSGALTVASCAARMHRAVYGVPGPISPAASQGIHELLRTGQAHVLTSVDQLIGD